MGRRSQEVDRDGKKTNEQAREGQQTHEGIGRDKKHMSRIKSYTKP